MDEPQVNRRVASVEIVHGTTGEVLEAVVYSPISEDDSRSVENEWTSWQASKQLPVGESDHWNWSRKVGEWYSNESRYPSFALRVDEQSNTAEGLMLVDIEQTCRLASQHGLDLVYIEYLEVAPWNRSYAGMQTPRYRRVGTGLVGLAVTMSRDEGWDGRIGLHSLPQAEAFYRRWMTDLGPDENYGNLSYFEATPEQASLFAK